MVRPARRPFWLPASNYYVFAVGVTIAAFFLIWGALHDTEETAPWIPAGIAGGVILLGAVFLREIILRKYLDRYVLAEKLLDQNLDHAAVRARLPKKQSKLTIEQNAELIRKLKRKSAAAKTLGRLADGHLEVFDYCDEYLALTNRELQSVAVGSPRLAAFRKGREIAGQLRREHLMEWAELEAKRLTKEAHSRATMTERIETAQRAFDVLATAIEHYPEDEKLIGSQNAIAELIASMRVGHWIEKAERAEFKGNHHRAISHYQDALFFMAREAGSFPDARHLTERIETEISRLSGKLESEVPANPTLSDD